MPDIGERSKLSYSKTSAMFSTAMPRILKPTIKYHRLFPKMLVKLTCTKIT